MTKYLLLGLRVSPCLPLDSSVSVIVCLEPDFWTTTTDGESEEVTSSYFSEQLSDDGGRGPGGILDPFFLEYGTS